MFALKFLKFLFSKFINQFKIGRSGTAEEKWTTIIGN